MATLSDFNICTGKGEGCTVGFTTPDGTEVSWGIPDNAIIAVDATHLAVAIGSGRLNTAFGARTNAPWRNLGMTIAMRSRGSTPIECVLVPLNTTVVWPPLRHWLVIAENAARDFAATSRSVSRPIAHINPCGFENVDGELRLMYYGEIIAAKTQIEAFVVAVVAFVAMANNPQSLLRELGVNASREPVQHSTNSTTLAIFAT